MPFAANPISRRDPSGLFSYAELGASVGIQASLGGMISGTVSRMLGGSFWSGFAEGAVSGALGGGFAFAASKFGLIGRIVFSDFAAETVEGTGRALINGEDLTNALVQGATDGAINAATGGALGFAGSRALNSHTLGAIGGSLGKLGDDVFRPFTKENFRENVAKYWKMDPPPGYHAHHVFPQEFEDDFREAGINPHNPILGSWWEETSHLKHVKEYNDAWEDFLQTSPTTEQILQKGRDLCAAYGLPITF